MSLSLRENHYIRATLRRVRRLSTTTFRWPFRLPDFLIVGAGKAGTTSLHYILSEHKQVYLPAKKESNFFAFKDEDVTRLSTDDQEWISSLNPTWAEYKERFINATTEIAVGEASPMYLYHPKAAGNIAASLPRVKVIAILREPLECAYSSFRMLSRQGRETREFLSSVEEDALRPLSYRVGSYLQKNCFAEQLQRFYAHFDREQVRVYLYEDFVKDPGKIVLDMLHFIGVDNRTLSSMGKIYNSAPTPTIVPADIKNALRDWAIEQTALLESVLSTNLTEWRSKLST